VALGAQPLDAEIGTFSRLDTLTPRDRPHGPTRETTKGPLMETRTDEIANGVFRFSTFLPDANIMLNQFLVQADEPLLFHTGLRAIFPLVSDAVGRVVPLDRLRWITFGHVEADECGAMNQFLAAAPNATVAHGATACMVQVNDLAERAPRPLGADEVLDLGGRRVRNLDTPHIPHGWDAHVLYEETTRTLFCGDLFTRFGEGAATTTDDIIEGALEAEAFGAPTALTPATAPTLRQLAELDIDTLALMHGPAYRGDCAKALLELADGYARMLETASA
jgi:flavorubredoxin